MFYGDYSWLDTILEKIGERIVATSKGSLSGDRVFETLASDEDHLSSPPGDRFVTVRPGRFPADERLYAGSGRWAVGFLGTMRVALFNRVGSDQELRSVKAIRDLTRGMLASWLRILDGLQGFNPVNVSGHCILKEPMRVVEFSLEPKKAREPHGSWCVLSSTWETKFITDLPGGNSE